MKIWVFWHLHVSLVSLCCQTVQFSVTVLPDSAQCSF